MSLIFDLSNSSSLGPIYTSLVSKSVGRALDWVISTEDGVWGGRAFRVRAFVSGAQAFDLIGEFVACEVGELVKAHCVCGLRIGVVGSDFVVVFDENALAMGFFEGTGILDVILIFPLIEEVIEINSLGAG